MVTLAEPPSITGLAVGLPLGVLLAFVFLITTVAVVIAVCFQMLRKKEEMEIPACEVEYEVVGPLQQPQGPDPITDMNVAYASTNF